MLPNFLYSIPRRICVQTSKETTLNLVATDLYVINIMVNSQFASYSSTISYDKWMPFLNSFLVWLLGFGYWFYYAALGLPLFFSSLVFYVPSSSALLYMCIISNKNCDLALGQGMATLKLSQNIISEGLLWCMVGNAWLLLFQGNLHLFSCFLGEINSNIIEQDFSWESILRKLSFTHWGSG